MMVFARAIVVVAACVVACDRPSSPKPESPQPRGHAGAADEESGAAPPADDDEPAPADEGAPTPAGDRVPAIGEGDPLYARVEGEGLVNDCKGDGDCKVGGCSGEVCSADPSVASTCDAVPMHFPKDAACGCVEGACRWWSASGSKITGGPVSTERPKTKTGDAPEAPVVECGGRVCKPGQDCVEYFGIAGPSGPLLRSCEWRCEGGCPTGTTCVTIADGPGKVCR